MGAWAALKLWTLKYLQQKISAAEIEFQGRGQSSADFELYKD